MPGDSVVTQRPGRTDEAGQRPDLDPLRDARHFPCPQCGADLEYWIGRDALRCVHCGYDRDIELDPEKKIEEQDYEETLHRLAELRKAEERRAGGGDANAGLEQTVECQNCSAEVMFTGTLTATECAWCGTPLQRDGVHQTEERIPVDAVLPFAVDRETASRALRRWLKKRWFLPTAFKRRGLRERFEGVFLPFWTFDSLTFTRYRGQRGTHHRVTSGSGKNRKTTTETRWRRVSGSFQLFLDDVLVLAARRLDGDLVRSLEPWPLDRTVPFRGEYLAGFFARTYDTELHAGFADARHLMEARLDREARRDIGGDAQRVDDLDVRYDAVTYKHLLLPLWLMSYQYGDNTYQLAVNAQTGQVLGERPWSVWKIGFAVVAALIAIAFFVAIRS